MSNRYFNKQANPSAMEGGKRASPPMTSGTSPKFAEKPGFRTGAPGRKQKDRSGGAKRAMTHPSGDGI